MCLTFFCGTSASGTISMDDVLDTFRARVCVAKLEVLRFEMINTRILVDDLRSILKSMPSGPDGRVECSNTILDLLVYCKQLENVAKITEDSILLSPNGRDILQSINDRMPP